VRTDEGEGTSCTALSDGSFRFRYREHASEIWLATNDPRVDRGGSQADIAPTLLRIFGVDGIEGARKMAGRPLSRAFQADTVGP